MKEDINYKSKNKSLKKAILFISIVLILIALSLVYRLIFLIKDSNYNAKDRFTVSIEINENNAVILSFNPQYETLSEIRIVSDRKKMTPGRIIGIPIDGTLLFNEKDETNLKTPSQLLKYALLHPGIRISNLNYYDLLRLYFFSVFISASDYSIETISLSDSEHNRDKVAQKYLIDESMLDEQVSIEIINGTSIQGLGKRLERVIRNSGGNVVSVTNSQETVKTSAILASKPDTYTQRKFEKLLKYPSQLKNTQGIADIKIVIGLDGIRKEIF